MKPQSIFGNDNETTTGQDKARAHERASTAKTRRSVTFSDAQLEHIYALTRALDASKADSFTRLTHEAFDLLLERYEAGQGEIPLKKPFNRLNE